MNNTDIIYGRNAVTEFLRSGRTADKAFVQRGEREGSIRKIISLLKEGQIPFTETDKESLDRLCDGKRHQGVVIRAAVRDYVSIEEILERARMKGEDPFVILLDGTEDPYNLGAVIRTANVVGAHGVIIPKRRAAGLTATVMKVSAGALNYTPVARVSNLNQAIAKLKAAGLWIVCGDMDGTSMYETDLTGPTGLIIGNEGAGVSRLVRENADFTVRIPMRGEINSLNASVSCAVLSYEIMRQRTGKKPEVKA
ncbi:MAG: 23S rRNA (guanosine(2251)-2'-O)-methyltransferase RlmB [Eubacteriales bacterium]|nr:23S rRNA (guanosine(2251)-2'-O)-methyltransferase RlmB [Eubacteriales bacterium]